MPDPSDTPPFGWWQDHVIAAQGGKRARTEHLVARASDADAARAAAKARPDRIASVLVFDDADPVPAILNETSGYEVDAFDIAESAIATARARYPDTSVRYRTADLLDPPADLLGVFDLVVDIFTVQALPTSVRKTAVTNISRFVGPNGILIAIGMGQDETDIPLIGRPWPLSRAEIESFASSELIQVRIADQRDADDPGRFRWLAEFHHVDKDSTLRT